MMRLARWVLAAGLVLAPGLALVETGCMATRGSGPPRLAGPMAPPAHGVDDSDDPCGDPDALDGLDDPCYVDVPAEEVRRELAKIGAKPTGGPGQATNRVVAP